MTPGPTSSPASTPEPGLDLAGTKALLTDLVGDLVGLVALGVRRVRRARRPYLPPHVWRATAADKEAIGKPLAAIAARHAGPIGASADLIDGARVVLAGADYVVTNTDEEDLVDAELAAQIAQLPTAGAEVDEGQAVEASAPAPAAPASDIARRFAP